MALWTLHEQSLAMSTTEEVVLQRNNAEDFQYNRSMMVVPT